MSRHHKAPKPGRLSQSRERRHPIRSADDDRARVRWENVQERWKTPEPEAPADPGGDRRDDS